MKISAHLLTILIWNHYLQYSVTQCSGNCSSGSTGIQHRSVVCSRGDSGSVMSEIECGMPNRASRSCELTCVDAPSTVRAEVATPAHPLPSIGKYQILMFIYIKAFSKTNSLIAFWGRYIFYKWFDHHYELNIVALLLFILVTYKYKHFSKVHIEWAPMCQR